jgi:hypothetical protein
MVSRLTLSLRSASKRDFDPSSLYEPPDMGEDDAQSEGFNMTTFSTVFTPSLMAAHGS